MFEIIDQNGVIYSGTSDEILFYWEELVYSGNPERIEWEGDLKLIEVIAIHK